MSHSEPDEMTSRVVINFGLPGQTTDIVASMAFCQGFSDLLVTATASGNFPNPNQTDPN